MTAAQSNKMIKEATLEEMKDDTSWGEVFNYGSPEPIPGVNVSVGSFGYEDVVAIYGSVEGANDCMDWVTVGKLKDGRYFSIRAGCDYTGWD